MHTFFFGWRRKAGCVVLILACLLAAMWLRSMHRKDTWQIHVAETTWHFLVSNQSWIYWQRVCPMSPQSAESISAYLEPGTVYFGEEANDYGYFNTLCTSTASFLIDDQSDAHLGIKLNVWGLPYWSLILPLTLLSAYLILWPGKITTDAPKAEASHV